MTEDAEFKKRFDQLFDSSSLNTEVARSLAARTPPEVVDAVLELLKTSREKSDSRPPIEGTPEEIA